MTRKEPTFEQAINFSSRWCDAWEAGELSDEVIADRIAELVRSKNGARGFFAYSLAGDCPIIDRLPDALLIQLRATGESIVDLTVRNLAMSTAMAVKHEKDSNFDQKHGSERIIVRCTELLRMLEPSLVKKSLEELLEGINGEGSYLEFLNRWEFNTEQKKAIEKSINNVAYN